MSYYCPECGSLAYPVTRVGKPDKLGKSHACSLLICGYQDYSYKFIKVDKFMLEDHQVAALKRVALVQRMFLKAAEEKRYGNQKG